jgi:hypothetical protein
LPDRAARRKDGASPFRKIAVMRLEGLSACSKDASIYLMVLGKGNEKIRKGDYCNSSVELNAAIY